VGFSGLIAACGRYRSGKIGELLVESVALVTVVMQRIHGRIRSNAQPWLRVRRQESDDSNCSIDITGSAVLHLVCLDDVNFDVEFVSAGGV
jgi:hypothetical protein